MKWIERNGDGEIVRAIKNASYDDIFQILKRENYENIFIKNTDIRDLFSEEYHDEFDTVFDAYLGKPEAKAKVEQMMVEFSTDMAREDISDFWEEVDDDFVIDWGNDKCILECSITT